MNNDGNSLQHKREAQDAFIIDSIKTEVAGRWVSDEIVDEDGQSHTVFLQIMDWPSVDPILTPTERLPPA